MLTALQAEEILRGFRVKNWQQQRLAAIAALPEPLATAGERLGKKEKATGDWWRKRDEWLTEAAEILDKSTEADPLLFFETMFPALGEYVEKAWQIQTTRLPIQMHYSRRAFRAPHNPELSRLKRGQWLSSLFDQVAPYDQDIAWIAGWSGYLGGRGGGSHEIAVLLAAAAEAHTSSGDEVFNILLDSARGEHETGIMGRHVIRALLIAERPEGWTFVEKMLIAAQRQEGLRQVILEAVDEAHPTAFFRMVRLILDQNLLRFSATIRAVDVWFGLHWTVENVRTIESFLKRLIQFVDDRENGEIPAYADLEGTYLSLWLDAYVDVQVALDSATHLLTNENVEHRFAAVHLFGQLGLRESQLAIIPMLVDEDLRIAAEAFQALPVWETPRPILRSQTILNGWSS